MKIFQFITFHTKAKLILSIDVLDLIKQMDSLEFMKSVKSGIT